MTILESAFTVGVDTVTEGTVPTSMNFVCIKYDVLTYQPLLNRLVFVGQEKEKKELSCQYQSLGGKNV